MAINAIKLPDNTVQGIEDSRIASIDATPTANSSNPVQSGGVASALSNKQDTMSAGVGIDVTSNVIANTMGIEYIVGTQSAATNAWKGVTTSASLTAGKVIAYYLPYAGNSSAATLNLTLPGGGTTGAKGIRRQGGSTVTTHFAANNVIVMIYDGTYWKVSGYYYTDSNSIPTGYCTTAASTAEKTASNTYGYRSNATYFPCVFRYANTASNATLAISSYATDALPIYVNGARTSSSNTFGAGVIMFLFYNNAYYCYNDGRFPIIIDGAVTSIQDAMPTKTSDLQNDSGFITDAGVTSFNGSTGAITYTAPVTSVNGSTGAVTVHQIPSGGTAGQVLGKSSGTDYDVAWVDQSGGDNPLPTGGSAGQVLAKASGTNYDVEWANIPSSGTSSLPAGGTRGQSLVKQSSVDSDASWVDAFKYGVVSQSISFNNDGTRTLNNVVWGYISTSDINLYTAAGAEYNGTNAAISKTAPWGETVSHLPGYFYLNGLGDISADEMRLIYLDTWGLTKDISRYRFANSRARTIFRAPMRIYNWSNAKDAAGIFVDASQMEVTIYSGATPNDAFWDLPPVSGFAALYTGAGNIFHAGIWNVSAVGDLSNDFTWLPRLHYCYLYGINSNIGFDRSPYLKPECVAYMIANAGSNSITVTLHATAYAAAVADSAVQSALSSKTNVSIASA